MSSIKESLTKKEDEAVDDVSKIGSDEVTGDQLKSVWEEFVLKLKKEGRNREYNTLNQQVTFQDDLTIVLTLPNSFQSKTIEDVQQELLTELRTKLNNKHVKLVTEIEKAEHKKLIYTNSEKFEFLADKYPRLRNLKQRLDLDTDF
jgi:chromosomal replication initiation ATPase DnaA